MKKKTAILSFLLILLLMLSALSGRITFAAETAPEEPAAAAQAAEEEPLTPQAQTHTTTRTILMYMVGADLESYYAFATNNLIQAMEAEYNENVHIVVLTGGSKTWHLPSAYLSGASNVNTKVNQVWELRGRMPGEEHGVMTLLEGQGLPGAKTTYLNNPTALTAFLNYGYAHYPADRYDLILWDHGSGPVYGFGVDERDQSQAAMSLAKNIQAFQNSQMIRDGIRFEMVDYDACLMSSVEVVLALSPYTDYLVIASEMEPGNGQYYTGWMDLIRENPSASGYDIGRKIVEDFKAFYHDITDYPYYESLSVVNVQNFLERILPGLDGIRSLLLEEATVKQGSRNLYALYDELYSVGAAFSYGDGQFSLYDLGEFVGALSCWQGEADLLSTDQVTAYRNRYTDDALTILTALGDDDNSRDDVLTFVNWNWAVESYQGRNIRTVYGDLVLAEDTRARDHGTGMSIFFPTWYIPDSYDYVLAMQDVVNLLPEGEQSAFLENYMKVVAYYALHSLLGQAAAEVIQEESTASYADLKEMLQSSYYWDYAEVLIDYLVDAGEFSSTRAAENYLKAVTEQQIAAMAAPEDITAEMQPDEYGLPESFRITAQDASAHIVREVNASLRMEATLTDYASRRLLENHGYEYKYIQRYFPDGFLFDLNPTTGSLALEAYRSSTAESDAALLQKACGDTKVVVDVPVPDSSYLILYDADDNPHIAQVQYINEEHTAGYIPLVVVHNSADEINYFIYVHKTAVGWEIEGLSDQPALLRRFLAWDGPVIDPSKNPRFTTVARMTDAYYGLTSWIPTSNFGPVDVSQPNWGIQIVEATFHAEAKILASGYYYTMSDIYGNTIDITAAVQEADSEAADGTYFLEGSSDPIDPSEAIVITFLPGEADGVPVDGETYVYRSDDPTIWSEYGDSRPGTYFRNPNGELFFVLPANLYAYPGYAFIGWTISGTLYVESAVIPANNGTYTATWGKEYTISVENPYDYVAIGVLGGWSAGEGKDLGIMVRIPQEKYEAGYRLKTFSITDEAGNVTQITEDIMGVPFPECTPLDGYDGTLYYMIRYTMPASNVVLSLEMIEPEQPGSLIHVTDYTKGLAVATLNAETLYNGEVYFEVHCETACVVALVTADGYEELACAAMEEGVPVFTLYVEEETTIALVLRGDTNLDGAVGTKDATFVRKIVAQVAGIETQLPDLELSKLAGDANADGIIGTKDATAIRKVVAQVAGFVLPWKE